jgi:hypothetical protein
MEVHPARRNFAALSGWGTCSKGCGPPFRASAATRNSRCIRVLISAKFLNMRHKFFEFAVLLFALLVSDRAMAKAYPMGFSILALDKSVFWQAPSPESSVCGLRIGLVRSLNESVCGIDAGFLISESREKFSGLALSGIGNISGDAKVYIVQGAGLLNRDRSAKIWGLQIAGGVNEIHDEGRVIGAQAALLGNWSPKANVLGFQVAAINKAAKVVGIQLGIWNTADELSGIQIGILNFNKASSPLYFFPGINVGF